MTGRLDNTLQTSCGRSNINRFEETKIRLLSLFYSNSTDWFFIIDKSLKDLENQLFIFRLYGNHDFYYVMCDADKKSEMAASKTEEEVRRCGKILYSSMDEDPPEALYDLIANDYFGIVLMRGRIDASTSTKINWERSENGMRGIKVARSGDMQKVREFLKKVGTVDWFDWNGWTMLHHAACCGDLNMIRILKDMNANTQMRDRICDRKPIHIAARECHTQAVELLLINSDSVNEVDKNGWTPLHYAGWKGGFNTVKYLISKNANTDVRDKYWRKKPIHVAVTEGHTDIVRIFLENGENVNDADARGQTLLYHSSLAGHYETAKLLIDEGADVNIASIHGTKPIHCSSQAQLTVLLLDHEADIESRNNSGYTPLHWAARGRPNILVMLQADAIINVVQTLVEKGANLNAVDNKGETPFDKAMAKHNFEIALYLAERMFDKFWDQNKYTEALSISEKLIAIQKEKLGQDHQKTLQTQFNVALILYELGKFEEALKQIEVILNIRQDPLHFDTLNTKYRKGRVYVAQRKLDEAMVIFQDVHKNWKYSLGADHHHTLRVEREIAFVHFNNCEYDEALKILEEIVEKRTLSLGIENAATLKALEDVAIVKINKGENENALYILKDVFEKKKSCLGANHPETLAVVSHIEIVEERLKSATEKVSCCIL